MFGEPNIDALVGQRSHSKISGLVIAESANVRGFQAQTPEAGNGRRGLATGRLQVIDELDLRIESWIFRHADQVIDSIGSKSDDIEFTICGKLKREFHLLIQVNNVLLIIGLPNHRQTK